MTAKVPKNTEMPDRDPLGDSDVSDEEAGNFLREAEKTGNPE